MPKDSDRVRVHFWMDRDDWEWYKDRFSAKIGFSKAVQTILHAWRVRLTSKAEAQATGLPPGHLLEIQEILATPEPPESPTNPELQSSLARQMLPGME